MNDWSGLPGGDLVVQGLDDLTRGIHSAPAALVSLASTRLRRAGVPVPAAERLVAEPDFTLYRLLAAEDPDGAHSPLQRAFRRLVSFERALECANQSAATASSR